MKTFTVLLSLFMSIIAAQANAVNLTDFKLIGDLGDGSGSFTLTATAHVPHAQGGALNLLSGPVALTSFETHPHEYIRAAQNQFSLVFDRRGDFPIQVKFSAKVSENEGWNSVEFQTAPSVLQPIILRGLPSDTQFQFDGAARPERKGTEFASFLPANGAVKFSWKEIRPESEGKLFFSAGMLSQITVSPGLMRQVSLVNFKVMQGELNRVTLRLRGAGEVTRVQGDQVLAWNVEPITNSADRRLIIQLNQPQRDQFGVQVQAQTALGAFPQTADSLQLSPEGATRFAGYLRVVNEGAVRLEVVQATGTSQISPEQFPESDATRAAFHGDGKQRFAYRFAGTDFALRIQADQILPELAVSETLAYHVGETELSLDAELELDIREAPLRELLVNAPKGYAVAKISAAGMSDYFLSEPPGASTAELRLVYGQPISGRQLVAVRLERNQSAGTNWTLPRVEVAQAKSVRGFVAVAADAGLRLTAERTKSLTEIATAFYPGKLEGIQTAFRLNDPAWEAALHIERLPQTVQASALHLFSIGEGIAYGSSVINYVVTGAPVAAFRIELSDEYYNVEFTGKDLRNWQKTNGGYQVQLHTPVTGAYTLLATYERPFKAQGETLTFTGAHPLDAQSEEGYTIVTSANQFDVKRAKVSPGLLSLEPGEVPPEYRLFFDAPVLAAYRYAARPFDLKLALSPLAQGNSLNQIVDRASFDTHISKEGQVLTSAQYFVKNRGNPNFRVTIPDTLQLWSATINGTAVVPVEDGKSSLIPLPQNSDPNAVLQVDLKLAGQSVDAKQIHLSVPITEAPVMLAGWKLEPDAGQRLAFQSGSVGPTSSAPDASGFAQLAHLFDSEYRQSFVVWTLAALIFSGIAVAVWRRAAATGVYRSGATGVLVLGILVIISIVQVAGLVPSGNVPAPTGITFLAPVQQGDAALNIVVANVANKITMEIILGFAWPVLAALACWMARWWIAGWLLLAWAALRLPDGAVWFFWVFGAFLIWQITRPVLINLRRLPWRAGLAPATAVLVGLLWTTDARAAAMPESVTQTIRVEEKFALATAKIRWQAVKGETLALVSEPAVLTHVSFPPRALKLEEGSASSRYAQRLVAQGNGVFDIEVQYQTPVEKEKNGNGFTVPLPYGLINRLDLTLANLDADVISAEAVSVHTEHAGSNTVASLVLSPAKATVSWHPRRRDLAREKAVFYAEAAQLYVPLAGVIEGAHYISIRPAQGELGELMFDVPSGATVTDVVDPSGGALVSIWRFDPDTGKLRVTLNPPQSRPFTILVRSQIAAKPLPFDQTAGLVTVENAAGPQIGLTGIATGNDVQLDNVTATGLSPINLEDFPMDAVAALQGQIPGITLRRAFRYSGASASVALRAAAVEPDVRVETDDTISLGEDRTVLADNFSADISRAGIFELSFYLPTGFDVESISSEALSQWTEQKADAGRLITLHLNGKTTGHQTFALTLVGPGVKSARGWKAPQVTVREAGKQRGSLLIVPEQGMRLEVAARDGYTQFDPQKSGVKQKGVLGFRALQAPASLALDIEQVDPWIQVMSLQRAAISEAQIKVTANLQYQIENTGLKSFRVLIPTNAEGVRFEGEQVGDFLPVTGAISNGWQAWEVKLHRRCIGQYLLQVSYQTLLPAKANQTILRSVEAAEVNLQRGFVTIQSDPRLQVAVDPLPASLQPSEWQGIPRALQKDLSSATANFTFRLVEPSFQLPLKLERHEVAKLLPAHVNNITFQSVVADDGGMLTRTRMEIVPGDKPLLSVTLPADARFWFAFVNDSAVWPWRDGDKILIPLDHASAGDKPITVELFHSGRAGSGHSHELDLTLLAPKFDLPLENITWKLSLGDKWNVKHWDGSLQLAEQETPPCLAVTDANVYLQNENSLQQARTAEAQQFLTLGNSSLEKGDPQQARRAFAAAYGLSTPDAAFNEDARVQLHNVKLQQALIGLNARQSEVAGDPGALGGKLRGLRGNSVLNYTQQDAKDIIDINTAEENAAFTHLAEKLIQQQDAAVNHPTGIRASMPDGGHVLVFKRAVAVDPSSDLKINLQAGMSQSAPLTMRILIIAVTLLVFAFFAFVCRSAPDGV